MKRPYAVLLSARIVVRDNVLSNDDFIALQRWAISVPTPKKRRDRDWQQLFGLRLHTNAHTDTAITLYLNKVWDKNRGDDISYYESLQDLEIGIGHSVSPAANRLVVNHS
jgi:hypothetical protein